MTGELHVGRDVVYNDDQHRSRLVPSTILVGRLETQADQQRKSEGSASQPARIG
jgi:hypothetical protein